MPRKTKEEITQNVEILEQKKTTKKATSKKDATKKADSNSKVVKEETPKKVATKKATSKKDATKKADSNSKVVKEETPKKVATKKTTPKKDATKKADSNSKVVKEKTTTRSRKKKNFFVEYYDLPNHYEQTIVKILAQTPTILFVYWNISDKDNKKLLKQYGENFFYDTYPILVVINKTKNYQFEVEINDYANSWYLHIPESDCEYEVILVRKSKNMQEEFSITSSNQLETPNDHILFEKLGKTIFFQNVKNLDIQEKDISSFAFMHNIGRIYNVYDLYKEIYKNELNGDELNLDLPSS